MLNPTPTQELLAHAIDVTALRQSVYAANIANANVEGDRRAPLHLAHSPAEATAG